MRTVAAQIAAVIVLGLLAGPLSTLPCRALSYPPPPECLASLTPGVSTLAQAFQLLGPCDAVLPGEAAYYAGGVRSTKSYVWVIGDTLGQPKLTIETPIGSSIITLIMVDLLPGIATSRGLTTLVEDSTAFRLYGLPDFAFERTVVDPPVRELFYLHQGLILVLSQLPGRPNWTITKVILTYPTYLLNAVALRERDVLANRQIEDVTYAYRVWARMEVPAQ